MWLDEEGAINGQPRNTAAEALLGAQVHGGALHGRVLVTHSGVID